MTAQPGQKNNKNNLEYQITGLQIESPQKWSQEFGSGVNLQFMIKGVDHMMVATLSGHKSIGLLKERYGHYGDETLRKAMTVFDEKTGFRKSPAL